ncbi:hypothetical protein ACFC0N_06285 [Streptomyces zaomyceticus]|uniref:hypothetical protein n=1 Tax=Streptomyces zaomyceticus TaxID=68286 RepID=UPI0035DAC405
MTTVSVRPSQRTADSSRSTPMRWSLLGIMAPQPQAYAGATSEPSWSASSATMVVRILCVPRMRGGTCRVALRFRR